MISSEVQHVKKTYLLKKGDRRIVLLRSMSES